LDLTTKTAVDVTATKATLRATIDTEGYETKYRFRYGTTTAYGSFTTLKTIEAGAEEPVDVKTMIEGLDPETTYHFQVEAFFPQAEGSFGKGKDASFTTIEPREARLEAEEYPSEVAQAKVFAEEYPLDVLADRDSAAEPVFGNISESSITCDSAELSGELAGPATAVEVGGQYDDCEFAEIPADVEMNSCHYLYGFDNVGPPYVGTMEIACDEEGDAIEVVTEYFTLKVAAQSPTGKVDYENQGEGSTRTVHADADLEGIESSCEGEFCFILEDEGNGKFGTIEGGLTLEARNEVEEQVGLYVSGG
jgi:hypothetical protein